MDKIRATFTLAGLKAHHACTEGYATLLASLPAGFPDDEPISLLRAMESNPVADVLWALRAVDQDITGVLPLLAADAAEAVLPLFERARPNDDRPRKAIEAARAGNMDADAAYTAAARAAYTAYTAADAADADDDAAAAAAADAAAAAAYTAYTAAARAAAAAAYTAAAADAAAAAATSAGVGFDDVLAAILHKYFTL